MSISAHADRIEDLQKRYAELTASKRKIETEMVRLEGMFLERQLIIKEQKVEALVEEEKAEETKEAGE